MSGPEDSKTVDVTVDGRTLRATGRTAQIATRIHPDYHHKAKMIAARDRITLAELIERSLDAYERERAAEGV